ncbi:hypothetical protein COHA_007058 [Chlorella ohadii]|uniref:non-specific serine/threonine protein kinase n=1 Tax=Chlorella ohadii TaxID=2649997 RepID=A0AAD5DMR9_9CHLO|nr:hypothetical protein COHA_007058 [Chlorella ohadii]
MRPNSPGRSMLLAALLTLVTLAAAQPPPPTAAAAAASPSLSPSPSQEPVIGGPRPVGVGVPGTAAGEATAAILGWATLSSLSATSSGPCGVYQRQSSAAMCWGRQVGTNPAQLANFSAPTAVAGGGSWNWLASGAYMNGSTGDEDAFACGIRADGSLACWGTDSSGLGLLGAGEAGLGGSTSPLPLAEPGPWSGLSAGTGFSCGIKSDDQSAWCWGNNAVGQLGCGSIGNTHAAIPCRVASGERWLRVVAGATTACGISAANEGSLWCWGDLNMSDPFPSPIRVMDSGVAAVAIGGNDTCIILRNQSAPPLNGVALNRVALAWLRLGCCLRNWMESASRCPKCGTCNTHIADAQGSEADGTARVACRLQ